MEVDEYLIEYLMRIGCAGSGVLFSMHMNNDGYIPDK